VFAPRRSLPDEIFSSASVIPCRIDQRTEPAGAGNSARLITHFGRTDASAHRYCDCFPAVQGHTGACCRGIKKTDGGASCGCADDRCRVFPFRHCHPCTVPSAAGVCYHPWRIRPWLRGESLLVDFCLQLLYLFLSGFTSKRRRFALCVSSHPRSLCRYV
jgi:hypothetical protein